jgi:hypothetical protein
VLAFKAAESTHVPAVFTPVTTPAVLEVNNLGSKVVVIGYTLQVAETKVEVPFARTRFPPLGSAVSSVK